MPPQPFEADDRRRPRSRPRSRSSSRATSAVASPCSRLVEAPAQADERRAAAGVQPERPQPRAPSRGTSRSAGVERRSGDRRCGRADDRGLDRACPARLDQLAAERAQQRLGDRADPGLAHARAAASPARSAGRGGTVAGTRGRRRARAGTAGLDRAVARRAHEDRAVELPGGGELEVVHAYGRGVGVVLPPPRRVTGRRSAAASRSRAAAAPARRRSRLGARRRRRAARSAAFSARRGLRLAALAPQEAARGTRASSFGLRARSNASTRPNAQRMQSPPALAARALRECEPGRSLFLQASAVASIASRVRHRGLPSPIGGTTRLLRPRRGEVARLGLVRAAARRRRGTARLLRAAVLDQRPRERCARARWTVSSVASSSTIARRRWSRASGRPWWPASRPSDQWTRTCVYRSTKPPPRRGRRGDARRGRGRRGR